MEGIVVKTIDYKEKSKLVYLYTPMGMMSVKALDVSKNKLGFVTTLNQVEFQTTSGKLPTVVEYNLKKSYFSLYQDLSKVGVLTPILDVIFHLETEVNHARIYAFFIRCLEELEKTDNPYFILSLFLVKMLAVFGIRPELKKCVLCGNPNPVVFSVMNCGALCNHCSTKDEHTNTVYLLWYHLYYTPNFHMKEFSVSYKEILDSVYQYYLVHANISLKKYSL